MTSSQLLLTSLFVLASCLLAGGWLTTRAKTKPLGYWPLAWAALFGGAGIRISPLPNQLDIFFGILFAALTLAGARQYAGRSLPHHFLAVCTSLSTALAIASYTPLHHAFDVFGISFEVTAIAYAAWLTNGVARRENRSMVHRFIAPGLLLVAAVDLTEYLGFSVDDAQIIGWLFAGVPVATAQFVALVDRINTAAQSASDKLERSVSLLKATLDSTADGILVVERNGTIASFNDAFSRIWQIPQEVLDARDDDAALGFAMTQLESPDAFFDKVKALYEHPAEESFDTLDFKDGRTIERYSRPQFLGDEIVGRVWSFRDVTERVRAEEVAARHQNHLEELVEERTQELMASRDRLREADRLVAVGTLAAGVAHQINNPVGVILNSAEFALLCDDEGDAKRTFKRALEVNVAEAKRCAAIVRSMLQFARKEPVEMHVDDLNSAVNRACRATETYVRDQGGYISVNLCQTPLPVLMSSIEIEQVVVNLVRNAVESREDGAKVEVTTAVVGDLARIQVTDNGRGIRAEEQGRVFDPFYSTRLEQGGTGLGLSVAHGIVTEHKGVISTESTEDRGTVFLVEFPIAEAHAS